MLKDIGCSHVILGHSERRQFFGETDKSVNQKTLAALAIGLTPIVCVGETLAEREADETTKVIDTQCRGSLAGLTPEQAAKIVIAYEPVWAIGTAKQLPRPRPRKCMLTFVRCWSSCLASRRPMDYEFSMAEASRRTMPQSYCVSRTLTALWWVELR